MGWGEPHGGVVHGCGSTLMVADAHAALDGLGVAAGPLARRVLETVGIVAELRDVVDALRSRVETLERVVG